jgi:hypothetical protein
MVRFELLLPLYSNDGRSIEQEKFLQTDEELVAQFGATSTDAVLVSGRWMYQSTLSEDKWIRMRVDGEDLPTHWEFFRAYKEVLLQRCEQEVGLHNSHSPLFYDKLAGRLARLQ